MATIIFDFDSTLVSCESLELILQEKLQDKSDTLSKIHEITQEGLKGVIPFSDSIARRLAIAAPNKGEVERFGLQALEMITDGIPDLIQDLLSKGVDVWVVSGGLYESLLPVCQYLGIDKSRVLGVQLLWGDKGEFLGIDPEDAFSRSKVEGVSKIASQWIRPRVIIGDAMSDYRLYEQKIVEHFILYTEHLECEEIKQLGVETANDTRELRNKIDVLIS